MTKRVKLLWVMGAILLAVGGAALASNMGFKFVPNIATADPDIYEISIPLNNNYTDLASIFNDINASAGCTAVQVTAFNPDQTSCSWTGGFTCNTAYTAGTGVRVSTAGPCTGWVIVGSHNPSFAFAFPQADPSIYDVSLPYHTTKTDLAGLFTEIPNAVQVTKFNPDQTTCSWTGAFTCNTTITIGEAYRVSVTVAGTTWTPSHY
jgi:hypothetical protein